MRSPRRPVWLLGAALGALAPAVATAQTADGPRVVELSPPDGALQVALEPRIFVRFDRPVDPATLAGDFQPSTTDFTLAWSDGDTRLDVRLAGPLAPDTTYLLAIANVFDAAGNALAEPAQTCFSTGSVLACPSFECAPLDATDAGVPAVADYASVPPFSAASVWNTPVPASAAEHAHSGVMIERFARTFAQFGGIWVGTGRDTVPVYFADASTPRQDVPLSAPNPGVAPVLLGVPIPAHAVADCGFDRFLGVLDVASGFFFELHRAEAGPGGAWSAATGNSIDARAASGIYPGDGSRSAQGVRASGASLLAGLVWPQELAAGRIDHALALGYQYVRSGGPLPPFTASDGQIDAQEAIPMGARLQLDPALDLDSLPLGATERVIARALQEYGAFLVDSAGGISLPAVHVLSFRGDPYAGLLPGSAAVERGALLAAIPPDRFRVLAAP